MSQTGMPGRNERNGELKDDLHRFYHDVFDFHVDVARRLVIVKFGARLTADEITGYVTALRSHPAFQSIFSEIIDLRETEELDLQANDFLRLADKVDPFAPQAKRAFVVRTRVQNHAARMHRILRGQGNIAIFESLEEAEAWIRS